MRTDRRDTPHNDLDAAAIDALNDMLGGDAELLTEMIDDFVAEVPARLAEARTGIETTEPDVASRAAHTLKSNALTFGALGMADLARQIESAARAGDLSEAGDLLPALEAAWVAVQPSLLQIRNGA
jgi:HPt (histidine-containing phosphotransfer) domain-containing protein